ncbi:MAG: heavy metal-responsive transcriptional regulator [Xenococcaceae cyanobacterium]
MQTPKAELLKIGELKARSGISVKTIRYYEELGLIEAAARTEGGFRLFSPEAIARLAFIKRAQNLGLSLQEIGAILQIHDQGKLPCKEVKQKLHAKILEIEQQIAQLQILKTQLISLIDTPPSLSKNQTNDVICPIIQQD